MIKLTCGDQDMMKKAIKKQKTQSRENALNFESTDEGLNFFCVCELHTYIGCFSLLRIVVMGPD